MRFLVLLLTYILQRKFNLTISRQHDIWVSRYLNFFEKQMPVVRQNSSLYLAIGIVLPALALSILLFIVDDVLFGVFTLFIHFVMLFLCLGCGFLKGAFDAYLQCWLEGRYEAALETLVAADIHIHDAEGLSQAEIHHAVCSAFLYQTFQRYFMVIFWFMVAGPVGALVARLAHISAVVPSVYRPQRVSFLSHLLEWIPARPLSLTFAISARFSGSLKAGLSRLADPYADALDVLEVNAEAALGSEKYSYNPPSPSQTQKTYSQSNTLGAGEYADLSKPPGANKNAVQLMGMRTLLNRSLVIWFAALALIALIEWLL